MRSLIKNSDLPECPEATGADECRHAQRRHVVRRLITLGCIGLATWVAFQFLRGEFGNGPVAAPEWTDPAAVFSSLRGRILALNYQFREAVGGALPSGDFGLIIKVAVCAVAAAVFLRSPRRA
jgi:hypothetical protein